MHICVPRALFTIGKTWNYPSTDKWIKKMWYKKQWNITQS